MNFILDKSMCKLYVRHVDIFFSRRKRYPKVFENFRKLSKVCFCLRAPGDRSWSSREGQPCANLLIVSRRK